MIYIIEAINRFFEIDLIWILLSMITGVTTFKSIKARKPTKIEHAIFAGILAAYCTLVLSYTIFSREATGIAQYIMNPIWAYKLMPFNMSYRMEIILNYILFIPLGFLTPRIVKSRKKYLLTILNGFCFSAAIEVTQLLTTTGLFELEDILGNTIGTMIGAILYFIYRRIEHRLKKTNISQHRQHVALNTPKVAVNTSRTVSKLPTARVHKEYVSTKMERYDAYIRAVDQLSEEEQEHHAHNYSLRHSNIGRHHRHGGRYRTHIRYSHARRR